MVEVVLTVGGRAVEGHQYAMRVPKGGSSCANCRYLKGERCTNYNYVKAHGSDKLDAPPDEFCSDFFEARK